MAADAQILVTHELLAQLLHLPTGWRVAGLSCGRHDDRPLVYVDVVFPDGPVGSDSPIAMTPRYTRTPDGISLTSLSPAFVSRSRA